MITGPTRLAAYLRSRRLTFKQFSKLSGASVGAVHNWTTGRSLPPTEYLGFLRDVAGIPLGAWVEPGRVRKTSKGNPEPHNRVERGRVKSVTRAAVAPRTDAVERN